MDVRWTRVGRAQFYPFSKFHIYFIHFWFFCKQILTFLRAFVTVLTIRLIFPKTYAKMPALFLCECLHRSAYPYHCDEGIFWDCLSFGLIRTDWCFFSLSIQVCHSGFVIPGGTGTFSLGDLRSWMLGVREKKKTTFWEKSFPLSPTAPFRAGFTANTHWKEPCCFIWMAPYGPSCRGQCAVKRSLSPIR